MVKCGNCKQHHEAAADVRACFEHANDKFIDDGGMTKVSDGPMWPPSEAQIGYVAVLQGERNLPDDYKVKEPYELMGMERDAVSGLIQLLKSFSRKEGSTGKAYTMPEGRYALQDNDGVWSFFQVDKPTTGRWAGYTFIKRLIGAPGQYRKEPLQATVRYTILDRIEADPKQAMTDYGLHSGVCGMCSSPLSDPDSLARGLGPICAGKSGWF